MPRRRLRMHRGRTKTDLAFHKTNICALESADSISSCFLQSPIFKAGPWNVSKALSGLASSTTSTAGSAPETFEGTTFSHFGMDLASLLPPSRLWKREGPCNPLPPPQTSVWKVDRRGGVVLLVQRSTRDQDQERSRGDTTRDGTEPPTSCGAHESEGGARRASAGGMFSPSTARDSGCSPSGRRGRTSAVTFPSCEDFDFMKSSGATRGASSSGTAISLSSRGATTGYSRSVAGRRRGSACAVTVESLHSECARAEERGRP